MTLIRTVKDLFLHRVPFQPVKGFLQGYYEIVFLLAGCGVRPEAKVKRSKAGFATTTGGQPCLFLL